MTTQTAPRFPADAKPANGKQPAAVAKDKAVALGPKDSVQYAVQLCKAGEVTPESLEFWAVNTLLPTSDLWHLYRILSDEQCATIAAAQAKFVAEAAKRGGKQFSISDTDKGVLKITLPGAAFPWTPAVESAECLLENVEALRAYLAEHGERVKAIRAAYKQSPEYAATVSKMKADRKQA
jgi:hypothetical protein